VRLTNLNDRQRVRLSRSNCVLLANPYARRVSRKTIARAVDVIGIDERAIREIGRDGTARALSEQAVREAVPFVVVAGGDGTLHQIIQVLAGTGTALAVVPLGTSNDLARRAGLPLGVAGLEATLDRPRVAALDLLRIGGRRIATVGGFGLPSHVSACCNRLRSRPVTGPVVSWLGGNVYSVVAASRILKHGGEASAYTMRVNDGPPFTMRAAAVIVGLGERFGGGMQLAADGEVSPGTFAALFVTATTRYGLLSTLVRVKLGWPTGGLAVTRVGITRLSLRSGDLVASFGDGEPLGLIGRTVIELEPRSLNVLLPMGRGEIGNVPTRLRRAV